MLASLGKMLASLIGTLEVTKSLFSQTVLYMRVVQVYSMITVWPSFACFVPTFSLQQLHIFHELKPYSRYLC